MSLQRRVYATLEAPSATETRIGQFIWSDQKVFYFLYINPLNTDTTIRRQIDTRAMVNLALQDTVYLSTLYDWISY